MSLVELLVAMAISIFLLGTIGLVYSSSKNGFVYANNTVRMSEDASFAIDSLSRDIRMAAYSGCAGTIKYMTAGSDALMNTADDVEDATRSTPKLDHVTGLTLTNAQKPNPFSNFIFNADTAVRGFPGGTGSEAAAAQAALGTSTSYALSTSSPILYVAGGSAQALQVSSVVAGGANTISFAGDPYKWNNNFTGANAGKLDFMLIADCKGGEVFRADSMTTAGVMTSESVLLNAYGQDAVVAPLMSSTYFLATRTGASTPSLFRRYFDSNSETNEELIPNVEAITFHYGENTSNTAAGDPNYRADVYRTDASAVINWSRVVSIRIGLIMVSEDSSQSASTATSLSWIGGTYTPPADNRLRRAYSTTVSIRNRVAL